MATTKKAKSSGRGSKPGERRGGRQKGTPNKTTQDVREAIALIAQRNVGRFEDWLDAVAAEDPAEAANIFLRAIEYHIPKLARSEVTGKDGKSLIPESVSISIIAGK